jgi:hypothetical protein
MLGNIARYAYGKGRSTRELVGKANRELLLGIPTNSRWIVRQTDRDCTLNAPAAACRCRSLLRRRLFGARKNYENPHCSNFGVLALAFNHVDDIGLKIGRGFRVDIELQRHLRAADAGKLGDDRLGDLADLRAGAGSIERDDAEEAPAAGVPLRRLGLCRAGGDTNPPGACAGTAVAFV